MSNVLRKLNILNWEQTLYVKCKAKDLPSLFFLHGGPGWSFLGFAPWFAYDEEKFFLNSVGSFAIQL